jgi:hypothetical protein
MSLYASTKLGNTSAPLAGPVRLDMWKESGYLRPNGTACASKIFHGDAWPLHIDAGALGVSLRWRQQRGHRDLASVGSTKRCHVDRPTRRSGC